jgi:hypothetical protein
MIEFQLQYIAKQDNEAKSSFKYWKNLTFMQLISAEGGRKW